MADKAVNIFSRPEEIDRYIRTKVEAMPRRGGSANSIKNAWSEAEMQLRDGIIMEYITSQGLSKNATAQQISDRWGITLGTARVWVCEASKRFIKSFPEEDVEEQRKLWLERVEAILQNAIDTQDKASALKAMDLMAKSLGLYKDTKDVNISGGVDISFDFS